MKFLSFLLVFMFLMQISSAVVINEIMADPVADETLNEWLEIYNDDPVSINVSGWIIGDDDDNDSIEGGLYNGEGTIIPAYGFAIITGDSTRMYNNFNVSENAIRLYVDGSLGGNRLKNDGETIYLYDNNDNLIDIKTYNSTTDGLSWAYINNSLFKSDPTPGFSNNGSIIINEGCDYAVNFILPKTLFDNSSEFTFKIRASKISGTTTNFTMRAKIEDLNGKFVRDYAPFTNESITTQRTSSEFTPNLDEGKSYILESNITTECNDANMKSNFDTQIITIKGRPLQEESSISIENILDLGIDKKAKFGQTVRVRLSTYKGNTNKKSVALWVESDKGKKLSKQSNINLEDKYTNYSITIPVQIIPNCDNELKDDEYILKANGLDAEDEEEIKIEDITDSLCEVKVIEQKEFSPKKFDFEIKGFNEIVDAGRKFNTKIAFDNNNNADIPIKAWSYVYRGSKSYSGDREENMKEFVLKANSLQEIELENIVDDAESGDYKFKVVVNKNNQKTNNEIIKDIKINNIEISKNESINLKNNPDDKNNGAENMVTANKVLMPNSLAYESATEKAKNLAPVFLIVLSVLLNIVLIWRR